MRKSKQAAKETQKAIDEDIDEMIFLLCHAVRSHLCTAEGCFNLAEMEPENAAEYFRLARAQNTALLNLVDGYVGELQKTRNDQRDG